MRHRINREQRLQIDIDKAWRFFSSPYNLSKITPPEFGFVVLNEIEPEIYEGMEIAYSVSPLFGIPLKWRTVITSVDPKKSFTDFQAKGPYRYWSHRHEFEPDGDGVTMRDTIEYEMPMGFLGELAHRLVVKDKLKTLFDHRFEILEKMFNNR